MNAILYAAEWQPATDFTDATFDPPHRFTMPGGRLVWCECCSRRRRAVNALVQCYYDGPRIQCAPGYGCQRRKP